MTRQMHLGLFLLGTGSHIAGWRTPGAFDSFQDIDAVCAIARIADRTATGSGRSCTHSNAVTRSYVPAIARPPTSARENHTRPATPAAAALRRACSSDGASTSNPSTRADG